ncbi:hypothetical protein SpCBS45565_g03271 [Spizellomyces sp. 'palustris']|nr:hypothetical protein SpCBS45565_g03271 [Spizellomyces sp. 'palustris']
MEPKLRPFKDIAVEIRSRWPYYVSDWVDGFTDKKVLAAGVFIFFANIAPAITFAFYLDDETKSAVGVSEVLLSTAISGAIYAVLSGQPLVIIGVTGPTSIFTVTMDAVARSIGVSFLPFYSWTILWSALMHLILAVVGACTLVRIVTRFSCEIFGALIAVVYLLNGGREILREFSEGTFETGLLSLLFALITLWLSMQLGAARHWHFLRSWMRALIADYAIPISVTLATVVSVVIPRVNHAGLSRLNVPSDKPFLTTTNGRSWIVELDAIPIWGVFAALIPGFILTILFYFDHNVSSLLSQRPENNLLKPSTYNWDFFVVGLTMIPCAILGIPPCNGLIPQAPLHVRALAKIRQKPSVHHPNRHVEVWERVQEQRVSNLMQALLTFIALIPPVLGIVGSIPRAVLAGLFLAMGFASFVGNQFAQRIALFFADPAHARLVFSHLHAVPFSACAKLTAVQLVFLAGTLGVTESGNAAALSFPLFIAALVPIRYYVLGIFIPERYLEILDADDGREFITDVEGTGRGRSGSHSVERELGPGTGMEGIGMGGGFHPRPSNEDEDDMVEEIEVNVVEELDPNQSSEGFVPKNVVHRGHAFHADVSEMARVDEKGQAEKVGRSTSDITVGGGHEKLVQMPEF